MPQPRVSRLTSAFIAAFVVAVGLGSREVLPEAIAGPVGDTLFATLVVVLVALVRPRTTPVGAAIVGLAACAAIELSHFTDVPAQVLERFPVARFALGTSFGAADLAWYALGAAVGGLLLAVTAKRPRWVDQSLRHGRTDEADQSGAGGRGRGLIVVPILLLVVVGGGVGWFMWDESRDLTAQLAVAETTLGESAERVEDEEVRTALSATIDDAEALLDETPILGRLPGEANRARERLESDVDAVDRSRLAFAVAEVERAGDALRPVKRRAETVLAAVEDLRGDGLAAGKKARTTVQDALRTADGVLATTKDLDGAGLAEVEDAAARLVSGSADLRRATTKLMTAQDALVCPYPDQVWFPEAGKLDPDRLAPIPWAPQYYVRADVVEGLVALNDAYRKHFGRDLDLNSAYRTYAQQAEVYDWDNPNPLAAPPGCSNHGLGTAVDISVGPEKFDSPSYAWLKDNAEEFGWTHPEWAEPDGRLPEPWHWQSVKTPTEY